MDESQKHCAKWNKQNTKTKYYVILFTWTVVKKKKKTVGQKLPGDGTVWSRVQGTEGNLLVWNYIAPSTIWMSVVTWSCTIIKIHTVHIKLVKSVLFK